MDELITLNLTLKELQQIDKYVEINDDTLSVIMKITNAYPQPKSPAEKAYYAVYGWYPPTVGTKCPETKLEVKKMTEIEKTKKVIEVLTAKLALLEEIENHKTPCEEAFKRVYGYFPTEPNWDDDEVRWESFQNGYNASKVSETPQEPEDNEWKTVALGFGENLSAIGPCGYYDFTPVEWYDWVVDIYENTANEYLKLLEKERARAKAQEPEKELIRESVKWCEEHPEESVEDYLKPHTPEKTEKLLREAFQKVQQTEEWKETQRKIDSNYDDMVKNPPEFLKFELGKTLEQLIERWWCDVFVGPNEKWTMEECIAYLCDRIQLWLPKSQSAAGSQSLGVEDMVEGFNDCLKKIKSKLRNKKDT